jgi:hypothetical protein
MSPATNRKKVRCSSGRSIIRIWTGFSTLGIRISEAGLLKDFKMFSDL